MKIKIHDLLAQILISLKDQDTDVIARLLIHASWGEVEETAFKEKIPSYLSLKDNRIGFLEVEKVDASILAGFDAKKRKTLKPGRIIKKMFTEDYLDMRGIGDQQIEIFVNRFLARVKVDVFEILQGSKVKWAYNVRNYYNKEGKRGTLFASCMRQVEKNHFFSIYTRNKNVCKILVLKKDGKILGRALLWTFKDAKTGKKYKLMDRIYHYHDFHVELFKNWAKENGYWHKVVQTFKDDAFINTKTKKTIRLTFCIPIKYKEFNRYPYMDTFYYLNTKGSYLTNSISRKVELDELRREVGCTHHRVFDITDKTKLVNMNNKRETVYLSYMDGYTKKENAHKLKDGRIYLKRDVIYSKHEKNHLYINNAVFSKHLKTYLSRNLAKRSNYKDDWLTDEVAIYITYLSDYAIKEDVIEDVFDKMFIFEKDAVSSKYHKGKIYIGNAVRLKYCGDYIHRTKAIKSVFENMHIALHHSVFIFGIGYMLKKNEEKARSTEFAVDADLPTEYETRKKEKKKPKEKKVKEKRSPQPVDHLGGIDTFESSYPLERNPVF